MHGEQFFFQAFVYLTAAVISVPIAKRLGLGSVLGYLIAGVIIGPFGLRLIGDETQDVMHFAEFGVVMMLFLIGLELSPALLWRLRGSALGLGSLQVSLTTLAVAGIGLASGLAWETALAVGLTLALSSTAIVLQTLQEKGLIKSDAGEKSFAVLLFQDIAVIPMLALMPLLAAGLETSGHAVADAAQHDTKWVETLPGWAQTLVVLGAVVLVVLAGRFVVRPVFRFVGRSRLREIFTAAALALVVGTALLMAAVGLSPALGTFLAGVLLANSEFRHELVSSVEPFKGLLLGLFFIAIGASIDFWLIATDPLLIAEMLLALIVVKFAVLFALGRLFRMGLDQNLLFALSLAQAGEFGFVLLSFAAQGGLIGDALGGQLVAVIALSMALTPLLMLFNEKLIQPRFGTREKQDERKPDSIHGENPVIIAGFGRFGHIVGRLLTANGVGTTVLDVDSDQVELLRSVGLKVFYGDASRPDLLHAAGADQARLFVVATDEPEKTLEIVHTVKREFPHLTILARAYGRPHAYDLLEAGVEHVYRETLDSSLRVGVDALTMLGFGAYHAHRAARTFRCHDEDSVRELAAMRHDRDAYIGRARERIQSLERILRDELQVVPDTDDEAWDTTTLCKDVQRPSSD